MKSPFRIGLLALALCSFSAPLAYAERNKNLQKNTAEAKDFLLRQDSEFRKWFDDAYGYVIFASVGKAGLGIGGAFGRGEVYERGTFIGKARLTQASWGFQAGGQVYIEVIFFERERSLDNFRKSKFAFSAQASAVAAASGAAANAKYEQGVAVFTLAKGGLMYEASVGGQKFTFLPAD